MSLWKGEVDWALDPWSCFIFYPSHPILTYLKWSVFPTGVWVPKGNQVISDQPYSFLLFQLVWIYSDLKIIFSCLRKNTSSSEIPDSCINKINNDVSLWRDACKHNLLNDDRRYKIDLYPIQDADFSRASQKSKKLKLL